MVARPLLGCSARRGRDRIIAARAAAVHATVQNVVNRNELPQDHVHCRVAERHGLVAERQRAPIDDDGLVAERHGLKAERRLDKCT